MLDIKKIRNDFSVLVNNPDLVYLDSAATSLKPQAVLNAMSEYYEQYTANIKRGIYKNSMKATEEYERSRQAIAGFIHAAAEEIIFTRNTTESINLVMYSLGTNSIGKGDEIVTTIMEHHSNFVPWQQLAIQNGATLKVIDIDKQGNLNLADPHSGGISLGDVITKRTKILTITHVSNVLGTINPVREIIASARRLNSHIIVIVDGAQAVPHMNVNVKELDADFYAFSGHKMYGPTGVGVLYGKRHLLEQMVPFQYGGEMIREVHLDRTVFADLPEKFEAGTPAIAEVIALRAAVEYISSVEWDKAQLHVQNLHAKIFKEVTSMFPTVNILSNSDASRNIGIFAFTTPGIHPHDIASILDEQNIAIRAGHHCTMPLHEYLQHPASARASLAFYNTEQDVERFITGLEKARSIFQ